MYIEQRAQWFIFLLFNFGERVMKSYVKLFVVLLVVANFASAGVVMHLEADSLGLADGASVGTWSDISGYGNDASQAIADAQPVYVASSTSFNDHATVSFDGIDDWMDLADVVSVDSFTMFLAGKLNENGRDQYFVSGYSADFGGDNRFRIAEYSWSNYMKFRVGGTDMTSTVKAKDTDVHIFAMNSEAKIWHDSEAAGEQANDKSTTPDIKIGSIYGTSGFLNGEIAEVIIYDEILDASTVDQINADLAAKYVPEPATVALLGLGGLLLRKRK